MSKILKPTLLIASTHFIALCLHQVFGVSGQHFDLGSTLFSGVPGLVGCLISTFLYLKLIHPKLSSAKLYNKFRNMLILTSFQYITVGLVFTLGTLTLSNEPIVLTHILYGMLGAAAMGVILYIGLPLIFILLNFIILYKVCEE